MYRDKYGWAVCGICGKQVANLATSIMCAECEYILTHDKVNEHKCSECVHFDAFAYYTCTKHLDGHLADEVDVFCTEFEFPFSVQLSFLGDL